MKNLKVYFPLVDGSLFEWRDSRNGKDFIHEHVTDDWGPPPDAMVIEAVADDGRTVRITIPYSNSDKVGVSIEDE